MLYIINLASGSRKVNLSTLACRSTYLTFEVLFNCILLTPTAVGPKEQGGRSVWDAADLEGLQLC